MANDRFVCTKENPWSAGKGRAEHSDAKYLRDSDEGDRSVAEYECPNCGIAFSVELAQ